MSKCFISSIPYDIYSLQVSCSICHIGLEIQNYILFVRKKNQTLTCIALRQTLTQPANITDERTYLDFKSVTQLQPIVSFTHSKVDISHVNRQFEFQDTTLYYEKIITDISPNYAPASAQIGLLYEIKLQRHCYNSSRFICNSSTVQSSSYNNHPNDVTRLSFENDLRAEKSHLFFQRTVFIWFVLVIIMYHMGTVLFSEITQNYIFSVQHRIGDI